MTEKQHATYKDNGEFQRKVVSVTITMYPRDVELTETLATYLGTGKSEAVRTAVRAMVAQLGIQK